MKFLEGIIPREYQQKIFESCEKKNCLVVLPTGMGKTLIALMLSIRRLQEFPGEKIIFLAPTKPLAEQHLNFFKKHLGELFADLQLFTGAVKAEKRKKIWRTADIIFSTPQCVANDLRNHLYDLKEACLLIEDEAHRCIKNYDYNFVAQKYAEQAKHQRILGLTASPGSEMKKVREICRNLSIETVELRTRENEDVKPYLQELEFEKVLIKFPPEFEEMKQVLLKLFEQYVSELKNRKVLWTFPSKTGLIELQGKIMNSIAKGNRNFNYLLAASACAQAIKIQHALELLETQTLLSFNTYIKSLFEQAAKQQSRGVKKLVSKREFNFVFMQSNELLAKNQEHPKIEETRKIVEREIKQDEKTKIIVFTQFRESANIICKKLNEIGGARARIFVGQAKKNGSGLSQKEQQQIISDFSEGKTNILCATCIAEEGLDIPEVNAVIFYEPVPSAIRAIQRTGRTARLMKGKLIMLITKKTRDEAFYYASRSREKKMKITINQIQDDFKNENNSKTETQRKIE